MFYLLCKEKIFRMVEKQRIVRGEGEKQVHYDQPIERYI